MFTNRTFVLFLVISICTLTGVGCNGEEESMGTEIKSTFDEGSDNWQSGFSDYPADWDESRFEFMSGRQELPSSVTEEGQAFFISGRNISDDLFMFIKREVTGLSPNTTYAVTFDVQLASQYPEESVGIGGSPGASVYLKAGALTENPQPTRVEGQIRMNIDKGNQSQGGADMVVLGNIGISGDENVYTLISRSNADNPISATTDNLGNLWVIVGTDSGFEGVTALYYNTIVVTLTPR